MIKNDEKYQSYIRILNKELIPVMGCTEPIALAYCASICKELLEDDYSYDKIKEINVHISPNVIKNVKSVIVPNTDGQKGIEAAVAIGLAGGRSSMALQVLSEIQTPDIEVMKKILKNVPINITPTEDEIVLNILIEVVLENASALVQIAEEHTNVVYLSKNGDVKLDKRDSLGKQEEDTDYSLLSMEEIFEFSKIADISDVEILINQQIEFNTAIAEAGLNENYGANIGKVLMKSAGDNIGNKAKATAAAASDARMNGCSLPVVINSGSGNQGVTASLPVIVYAKELNKSRKELIRALVLSNLTTIYQKTYIGRLSAFCGVVSAGAGSSAGIALLKGGDYNEVSHAIVNTLAIASGMICDGAKSSCAAKIATAVDAGILGYEMYQNGQQFFGGDGIIAKGVENTIQNVGHIGKKGMYETDREIIKVMIERT